MKDNLKTLAFALALAVVCAGLLTAANRLLADRQKANEEAERWRNVFAVLDLKLDADDFSRIAAGRLGTGAAPDAVAAEAKRLEAGYVLTAPEMVAVAARKIREREVGELAIFEYDHPEAGRLRAIEFAGPGLWGPVEGLLCLKADLATVFAVSFYKHEETPGLGGEIGTADFRNRFQNKNVALPGAEPGILVVPAGAAEAANEIDGISGATMTCDKVQAMLRRVCERIAEHREDILREADDGM